MNQEATVTLETLAGGAAAELFQAQLDRVVQNILDPNTPAQARRAITLKVTIEPDEERGMGAVGVTCEAKLSPAKGAHTTLWFGRQRGRAVAVESDPRQGGLFDVPGEPIRLTRQPGKE